MKLRVILFVILNVIFFRTARAGDFLDFVEFRRGDEKKVIASIKGRLGNCSVDDFEVIVGTNRVLNCPNEKQPHRRYFVAVKEIHKSFLEKISDHEPDSVKGYEITSTEYNDDPNELRLTPGAWR